MGKTRKMTGDDWERGYHPLEMLRAVINPPSNQRRRFAAEVCRALGCEHAWARLSAFADGEFGRDVLYWLQQDYQFDPASKSPHNPERILLPDTRAAVVVAAADGSDYEAAEMVAEIAFPLLGRKLIPLIQCLFVTPFYPVWFDPDWRSDTAVSLARHIYESRDSSAMPILADALQEAGCEGDEILTHCRDESLTHVRGCWVVDLILGKQ